jgi:hypothetical protein
MAEMRPPALEHSLDTDQSLLGGSWACSVVALYWTLMMLHEGSNVQLKRDEILRFMKQGCVEWSKADMPKLLYITEVLKRFPAFAPLLVLQEDHQFLMMTPHSEAISVQTRHPELPTLLGVLEQLRARVTSKQKPLVCVFTRGLYTMVFRMVPDPLVPQHFCADLLESHAKQVLRSQRQPCATWVQCYSVQQLLHYLELYYPPYDEQVIMPSEQIKLCDTKPHAAMGSLTVCELAPRLSPMERSTY